MMTKVEELERIKSGIPGLDEMCGGGLIQGTVTIVAGHFGTGKTLSGLQFLKEGLKNGEKCIFISFVENPSDILKFYDILKTDWKLDINKGNLLVLPANIFKIDVLLCSLKKLLSREKITRVFIDEIPLAFEKKVKISGNINKMLKALKKNEISSFFTTTISKKEDVLTLGNISFLKLTDNIAVMRRMEKGNDIVNFITILKVRGSIHDAKSREIRLTKEGLEIYAGKKESDGEQIPDVLPVSDLSYYIWHFSPEDERINKIVKGFCLKNTNINVCRVERDKQTDIGEFYFDSNHDFLGIIGKYITTPDTSLGLVCLPYGKVYQYAGEGMLMNVDSFIDKSDYLEESVESCSYNDKLYGVPFTVGCKSLMYRKDLLEKYKINVPETWDELMNAEQYILNKENDPALQGVSFQWEETEEIVSIFLGFIWGNNGDIFDSRSNIIADERIISALECMKKVLSKYRVLPENKMHMFSDNVNNFFLRKSIFLIARAELIEIAFGWDKTPLGNSLGSIKEDIAIAPLPKMEKSSKMHGLVQGSALCIPKNTKDPKSAGLFLKYMISEEISKKITLINWPFPAKISLWKDKEILNKRSYYASAENILKDCRGINKEIKSCPEIKYLIREKLLQIINEEKKPGEAWESLAKDVKELLKRNAVYKKIAERVISYTAKRYNDKEFYKSLLTEIGLSPHYLQRIFKIETGMTISNYLIKIRIEKAKELLKDVKYNIGDVAQKVGYSDSVFFSKLFKKYTKYTPTGYRAKY